jgi:uncharacterized protein (DUF697 family)
MTDRDYIFAFDLNGKDVIVTIAKVVAGELASAGGRKAKKPIVYFEGKEKGFALNATNAKTIAALYGNYVEKWIGESITIYPTVTQMGGETVECIRVRTAIPGKKSKPDLTEQVREQMEKSADA